MKPVLKIMGGLAMLAIIVGSAYYYYYSQPHVVSFYTEPVTQCSSPDARDFYEKGTASYSGVGESGIRTSGDICDYYVDGRDSRKGRLRQSFCEGNKLVTENIDCGIDSVCRQGRCFKGGIGSGSQLQSWSLCSDSDGGVDIKKRGWLEGLGSGRDECWTSSDKINPENNGGFTDQCLGTECYQYEYFCNGDERAYKITSSPLGCENGVVK